MTLTSIHKTSPLSLSSNHWCWHRSPYDTLKKINKFSNHPKPRCVRVTTLFDIFQFFNQGFSLFLSTKSCNSDIDPSPNSDGRHTLTVTWHLVQGLWHGWNTVLLILNTALFSWVQTWLCHSKHLGHFP